MASKSIMFMAPRMNLSFLSTEERVIGNRYHTPPMSLPARPHMPHRFYLGAQASRRRYSRLKKPMVITSMTFMICRRMGSSTSPSAFTCSSSMVDMIKVKVEIRTIVREKKAQNLNKSQSTPMTVICDVCLHSIISKTAKF